MSYDLAIILISVSVLLIIIQAFSIVVIKKMVAKLAHLTKDLKIARLNFALKSKKEIIYASQIKTCQNCYFRQTFINKELKDDSILFYRCKLNGIEVDLKHSCANFHIESSTSDI